MLPYKPPNRANKFSWTYKTAGKALAAFVLFQTFYWVTDIPFSIEKTYTINIWSVLITSLFFYIPMVFLALTILRLKDPLPEETSGKNYSETPGNPKS